MLDRFKSYLESVKITPISWLVGISGVLMVRFFLESLSNPTSSGYFASDSSTLIHYWLFFTAAFLAFMIILNFALPEWKSIIPQFVAVSSLFVFIAPLLDWIISRGQGFKMTYFFDEPGNFLMRFLTFGGSDLHTGATLGLRVELILLVLGSGALVYLVRRSWLRAALSSLVLYVTILFFGLIPSLISFIGQVGNLIKTAPLLFFQKTITDSQTVLNNLHSSIDYSTTVRFFEISFNFIMGKVLFLLLICLSAFWFYFNFKEKFLAVVGDLRSNRTIHFILMIFLGLLVAFVMFPSVGFNWNDWLSVVVLCLSFYFSIRFAICVNDIVDEEIDEVTNVDRPLVSGSLKKEEMKQAAFVFLLAALVAGFLAGYTAFFSVLTFTALYYIYSAPPTRFKLIPFFASFIIGLCSLAAVISGFFLLSPLKQVSVFPTDLTVAIVAGFSLLTGIRDLKDIEGDKKAGIKTVPIIFGDVWGFRVVGFLAALSYILIPIIFNSLHILITALPAALATYYFTMRKPYVEKYIFHVYFAFMFMSALILFW